LSVDVVVEPTSFGLELVDALTGRPLLGRSAVVETTGLVTPYLVNASRWVFTGLPATAATFVITAQHYVTRTVVTPADFPNPTTTGPGYLATVAMMPRTGYPFPPTLTRVVGLVKLGASIDLNTPPVPNVPVVLTPMHAASPDDSPVTVMTTDDGQYTFWFLPQLGKSLPIAGQLMAQVMPVTIEGHSCSGAFSTPLTLIPNGVTYAPDIILT
jgi:hypothetical protein